MPSPDQTRTDFPELVVHATSELGKVRRSLDHRFLPDQGITVLLYVPLEVLPGITAEPLKGGALVDVRSKPAGVAVDPDFVAQSAGSGVSGELLPTADFATGFSATTREISEATVVDYKSMNPSEMRRDQVKVESRRHTAVEWPSIDCPPVGIYIHHHPLATPAESFHHLREPALGTVYTLSASKDICDSVKQLPLAAIMAARAVIKERVGLFGDRLDVLSTAPRYRNCDPLFNLACSFLFGHHWFYPYSPLAFEAMVSLAEKSRGLHKPASRDLVNGLYKDHGWAPPLLKSVDQPRSLKEMIQDLAADLTQIGAYRSGLDPDPLFPKKLEPFISTMLLLLLGEPAAVEASNSRVRWTDVDKADYICLLPRAESLDLQDLCVPVFRYDQVKRQLHVKERTRVQKAIDRVFRQSRPGMATDSERTFKTNAEFAVNSLRDGNVVEVDGNSDRVNDYRWLLRESLALLLTRLLAQEE